jgi:hypothetical protein
MQSIVYIIDSMIRLRDSTLYSKQLTKFIIYLYDS